VSFTPTCHFEGNRKNAARNIEFLIKETYAWFANPFIRQLNYAQIYQILNGQKPLKILRATEARLLIEPVVK